jgi:type IV pilus assembly protein PilN
MLEINLLPVREAKRAADLRQVLTQFALVMLLAAAAIALAHSRIKEQIALSESRVQQMQNDIDQFKPQLEQVAAYRKRKAELEKKIDVIEGLDRARTGPVRVLTELTEHTPERLWLVSLDTKGKAITMKGQSLDNELVALFLKSLGGSKHFTAVDLDSTELTTTRTGLKVVNFTIRALIVAGQTAEPPQTATPTKAEPPVSAS